ncbi:hypothetical protein EGI22_09230 [Lacihabitans sp. LS3-19]|uniref:T9SS type B sorting domain-containing protein n=1 Tax=Lacihabitans sp. LS3-19 TaxID=2487335 RepID=UPI0020CC2F7B|nr:gliding motility-associated C-terminal domain-containing protein [Lacihabitans sp. LS3-19]MCP9768095.1 hypothetical protein [Lacihabitans sp. LS3-19]
MNTFPKKCILFLLLALSFGLKAQVNNVDNLGFEKGTFEGWTLSYGNVKLVNNAVAYQNEQIGSLTNRNIIVSKNDGNDPNITQEAIPVVNNGGKYAMRIGKTQGGNTFDKASTSFKVTADHSLFQYHFAVLLQEDADNHHTKLQKPGFSLKITDAGGTQITCGDFDVQLEGNLLAGFKAQGDIEYKNWTTGSIDLRQHVGKTLNVDIIAHGCTGQGHFGYAYFNAELIKSEIKQASICPDLSGNITLLAPEGFEKYKWNNGSTNRALSTNAALNSTFIVTITPFSSLDEACNFSLQYKVPFKTSDTTITMNLCDGEHFSVDNETYQYTGNYNKVISRGGICDSTVNLNLFVFEVPKIDSIFKNCLGEKLSIGDTVISTDGIYVLKIPRKNQCDSIITADVRFENLKIQATHDQSITIGDEITLEGKTLEGITGESEWLDENQNLCKNCNSFKVNPIKDQEYVFTASSLSGICTKQVSTFIKVQPCVVHFPDAFTPDSDNYNHTFFGLGSQCISKISTLKIFDRWGEEVYNASNLPVSDENYGWDGTKDGKELNPGVYIFKASAIQTDGTTQFYQGTIELMR